MNHRTKRVHGFTLIELLVVITIIGMLMAMVLPAVNGVIATAKGIACRTKLDNLAEACNQYELNRKHYPGYRNKTNGNGRLGSWVVEILPYIGQKDLHDMWEKDDGKGVTKKMTPYLDAMICPLDLPDSESKPFCSYVINAGAAVPPNKEKRTNGIAHDYVSNHVGTRKEDATNLTSLLLLSENIIAGEWHKTDKISNVFVWHIDELAGKNVRKINGKGNAPRLGSVALNTDSARPSSWHKGGVNVSFADGHTDFLSQTIDYKVYMFLMVPKVQKSDIPVKYKTGPSKYILSDADY